MNDIVYRPMLHPHFVAVGGALSGLGAEQQDLFAVDWTAVKALGGSAYHSALLAHAQGAMLGMPQATIDTAINVLLLRHKAPNLFRGLFGLYPLSVKGYLAERDKLVRAKTAGGPGSRDSKDWEWFQTTNDAYTLARARIQADKGAKEITAAELAQIAKIAGWTDQQRKDALAGKNVYKLRPTPWATYAAVAGGALLVWWLLRRTG